MAMSTLRLTLMTLIQSVAAAALCGQQLDVPLSARVAAEGGSVDFELEIPVCGRYRTEVFVEGAADKSVVWVEDYIGNPDGRSYDITGPLSVVDGVATATGSPLDVGSRKMRLHCSGGAITAQAVRFTMVRPHALTPTSLVQNTEGKEWVLVWSDEFDGEGPPDPSRWASDIGDWGWGNRELQYYTEGRVENACREDGCLVIEARKGDMGRAWTSARLTTRGKISFLYGRIDIRAKVPAMDGAWAAGWLLGDAYRDEKSWPYCGEMDVLEAVGREIDDSTGHGRAHGSCHTRAYYFKQGNHISATREVKAMSRDFHVYSLDWLPGKITMSIDGEPYYVYDKTNGPLEWPFDQPQNLILNLAIGGGMGGAVDPDGERARYVIDYVRVYGRQ